MNEKRPEDIVTELLENHDEAYIKKVCRNLLRRGFGPEGDRKWQHLLLTKNLETTEEHPDYLDYEEQVWRLCLYSYDQKFDLESYWRGFTPAESEYNKSLVWLEEAGWEICNISDDHFRDVRRVLKRRIYKSEAGFCPGIDKISEVWDRQEQVLSWEDTL